MLKENAEKNKTLRTLFHDSNKRSGYEERILRFFVMRSFPNIKSKFKLTMNAYMNRHKPFETP